MALFSLLKAKNETLRFAQGDKLDLLRLVLWYGS
jgi:hypothetical protein